MFSQVTNAVHRSEHSSKDGAFARAPRAKRRLQLDNIAFLLQFRHETSIQTATDAKTPGRALN